MDIVELECSDEVNTFVTEVDLTFRGELGSVTESEFNRTERGFGITYNGMNVDNCDPFFRRVVGSTIIKRDEVTGRRSLQSGDRTRFFVLRYLVAGECRGCDQGTLLFNDALRRRTLQKTQTMPRMLQRDPNFENCTCPADMFENGVSRAPTPEEYTDQYNLWLENMHDAGNIDPNHITEALNTVERQGEIGDTSSAPLFAPGGGVTLVLFILFVLKVL